MGKIKNKGIFIFILICFIFFNEVTFSFAAEEQPTATELANNALKAAYKDWLITAQEEALKGAMSKGIIPELSDSDVSKLSTQLVEGYYLKEPEDRTLSHAAIIENFLRDNNLNSGTSEPSNTNTNTEGSLPIASQDDGAEINNFDLNTFLSETNQQSYDPDLYADSNSGNSSSTDQQATTSDNTTDESGTSTSNTSTDASSSGSVECPDKFFSLGDLGLCVPESNETKLSTPFNGNPVVGILESVMMWLLGVVGAIAIIAFIISGLQYFLAAGDQNSMESAKRNVVWSIVGVVVALSGIVILGFIEMMLS